MATESLKRIIHDWSNGDLVIVEIEMTDEEQNGEIAEVTGPA